MSFRDVPLRNNEITCDTDELKELVTSWTASVGWEFYDFAQIIKLVGITLPVRLCEYNQESYYFKCVNPLNKKVLISLFYGDTASSKPSIQIVDGSETKLYTVNCNTGDNAPAVTLQSKIVDSNHKSLAVRDFSFGCYSKFEFELKVNIYLLTVEIVEDSEKHFDFTSQNYANFEKYLFGLDNSLNINDVFRNVSEILGISKDCPKISISYTEIASRRTTLDKIIFINGTLEEYEAFENGESIRYFNDGNWVYKSDEGIKISYAKNTDLYAFLIEGTEAFIAKNDPGNLINSVKDLLNTKISEL